VIWGMDLATLLALGRLLGSGSHGAVTAAELRLAGAPPDLIKTALVVHWQRQLTGIYVTDDREITEVVKAHVAVKHAGEGAVVSGLVAARLLGYRWVPDSAQVQVLIEAERRRRSSEGWVLVRRFVDIHLLKTISLHGLEIAPAPKLLADAARELRQLRDVRGLVLGAIADERCTAEELRAVLDSGAVAGTALARRACLDAERGATSPPEAELVDALLELGLPFYCNVEIWLDGVLLGVADAWLVGTGVGAELDSREFHAEGALLDDTLLRDKRFSRAGLELCHITPGRYRRDPQAFLRELLQAVMARRSQGQAEPAGLTLRPRGPLLGVRKPGDPRNAQSRKRQPSGSAGSVDHRKCF
jgi:hypothetical protein